jgi:arylsulfatase
VFGNRALRQGDWKIRWQWKPFGTENWELFNLADDPAERINLATGQPDRLSELLGLWDDYVHANNVILPTRSPYEGEDKLMPERFPVDAGYPAIIYKKQFIPPKNMMAEPKS